MPSNDRRYYALMALATFAASVAVLSLAWVMRTGPDAWAPLDNPSPQQVLSRVDGVEGPAVRMGDTISVRGTKCVRADKPVSISGNVYWQRVDDGQRQVFAGSGTRNRAPGCQTNTFENSIPDGVVPGVWEIHGQEVAISDAQQTQVEGWWTEPFIVLPAEPRSER